jgi:hypothetical protein
VVAVGAKSLGAKKLGTEVLIPPKRNRAHLRSHDRHSQIPALGWPLRDRSNSLSLPLAQSCDADAQNPSTLFAGDITSFSCDNNAFVRSHGGGIFPANNTRRDAMWLERSG